MDADHAESIKDTIAFMRARFNDDLEGAGVLLEANGMGILIGLVDMNLAFVKLLAEMLRVPEKQVLDTMTTVGGWMTGWSDV